MLNFTVTELSRQIYVYKAEQTKSLEESPIAAVGDAAAAGQGREQ